VQHWVQTHDERAGPLLDALTGYLRATLPMFDQPLLILAQELEVVQRYLQVMQARLGDRLNWRVEIDAALHGLRLPPGALLTLAENAIEHGIEPQLRGGELLLRGRREGDAACLEVIDNGPGPAAGMAEGVGLANLRQRLALTCGDHATLTLGAAPGGGFGATLRLPLDTGTR
jgi:LytS/YehU family sensor histidine kinase